MNKKAKLELGKIIIYSIISAIIFLIIYSWWFGYPQMTGGVIDSGKEYIQEGYDKIKERLNNLNSSIELKTSGVPSFLCEKRLNDDLERYRIKNPDSQIKVIEKKSFSNLEEAIWYVEDWNIHNSAGTVNILRRDFSVNYGRIDMVLIRAKFKDCFYDVCTDIIRLEFGVCISEEKILYAN